MACELRIQRVTVRKRKGSEAFICCSAVNRLLVQQGTPKGRVQKKCVCVFFFAPSVSALHSQEVSNSSCVVSGLSVSAAKKAGCLVYRENSRDHVTFILYLHADIQYLLYCLLFMGSFHIQNHLSD